MGSANISGIRQRNRPTRSSPDAAGPVGRVAVSIPITLTAIVETSRMTLNYGEELDGFQLVQNRALEVRGKETPPKDAVRTLSMEVSTHDVRFAGFTVVHCIRPTSMDWFDWSKIRAVTHDPQEAMNRLLTAARANLHSQESAIWEVLKGMGTDPFGNEKSLYARFFRPRRTDTLALEESYPESDNVVSRTGPKANRKSRLDMSGQFGICENFDRARDLLRISEILQGDLDAASQGRGVKHDGFPMALTPTAQSLAHEVMEASIVKALAGVDESELSALTRSPDAKAGTVALWASWVFHNELRNISKRGVTAREAGSWTQPLSETKSIW
jgi:hypothetical protein